MTGSESIETELKFEVAPSSLGSLVEHPAFKVPARTQRLRTVYFDTPRRELRAAGLALRIRQDEHGFVQTVKQAQGDRPFTRAEWERPVRGDRPDRKALAKTPAGDVLDGDVSSLQPVFSMVIDRTTRLWNDGVSVVELDLDEGEITAGARREPVHEVELELKTGEAEALFSLARDLAGTSDLRLNFESKAARGYRLADDERPAALMSSSPSLDGVANAAEAFRRIAWSCLAQVAVNSRRLGQSRSPEALHQARVGLRRLRAAFTAFKPMLTDTDLPRMRAESKWLAGELDAARDLDVFIRGAFRPAAAGIRDDDGLAAFGERLLHAQDVAYDRAVAAAVSQRASTLLLDAAAWIDVGPWSRRDEPVQSALREQPPDRFGRRSLGRLRRQVRKCGRNLERLDPKGRHRLRIRTKKLRYAADFFATAFDGESDKAFRTFIASLKALQKALGELNDMANARRTALSAIARAPANLAIAAGEVVGHRRCTEQDQLRAALRAFDAFADAPVFWDRA